jgi:hypothetical protein
MDIDRSVLPAGRGPVKPKRIWISPAVVDLGAMRELTLLQGGSGGGECLPPDPCA